MNLPRRPLALLLCTFFAIFAASCGGSGSDELADAEDRASESAPTDAEESATTEPTEPPAPATPEPTPVPDPTPEPEPTASLPEQPNFELTGDLGLTTEEINAMVSFVEESTGREFLYPPKIVAQTESEFSTGLTPPADEIDEFVEDGGVAIRAMQAYGHTELGVQEALDGWLDVFTSSDGILAYYDIETDTVFMPIAEAVTDDFRSTLVHELVHALDGQHVDLVTYEEDLRAAGEAGDFDGVFTRAAVLEGRATSVQGRWNQANSVVLNPELSDSVLALPPAIIVAQSLPYALGAQFVEGNGGPAETWELYETGPKTSEAILNMADDEPTVEVAVPAADGEVLDTAPFGAVDLVVAMLGDALEPSPTKMLPTLIAAEGWAGGQQVVWGDDSTSCVRVALAADTPEDLAEIEAAFELWVAENPDDRSITPGTDVIEITGCAPYLP